MISIDSDILRSVKASAAAAAEGITSGVQKLQSVTTHDDWNCAERDTINDQILSAKKSAETLYERTQSYLELIQRTADKFDEVDYSITQSFQNVHDSLSKALSIKTPCVYRINTDIQFPVISDIRLTKIWSKKFLELIEPHKHWVGSKCYNVISNMDKPISVCKYSDVDFSKLSGGGKTGV